MRFNAMLAGAAIALATPAMSTPIEYLFNGQLSGTLNGAAFTLATTELSLISDTDLVFQPSAFRPNLFNTPLTTLNFTIGGNAGRFTSQFNAFSNIVAGNELIGFTEFDSGNDLIDVNAPTLLGYDLRSAAGPVTNSPVDFLNFDTPIATSLGELVLADDDNASVTFRARLLPTSAVPETGTWAMFIGGFGLVGLGLRRRQAMAIRFA